MNKKIIKVGFAQGCSFIIKKTVWERVGGYEEFLSFGGDDNDLGIKLNLAGYTNYTFTESIQRHLGITERTTPDNLYKRTKLLTYAHLVTITKNYSFFNLVRVFSLYFLYSFAKSIKQSVKHKSIKPFFGFAMGSIKFLQNISKIIVLRKKIQNNRIIKKDIFLKIPEPNFWVNYLYTFQKYNKSWIELD